MNMGESIERTKLGSIGKFFNSHGVEFIVIGGAAANLLGSPVLTYDIDLCYRRTEQNLKRLAAALKEIHPTLRGAPSDLPFIIDSVSLALGANFTFNTDFGPLDLLGWVEPIGVYESLLPNSILVDVEECTLRVIGIDDLIRIKRHIGRTKDRKALKGLEDVKRYSNSGTESASEDDVFE